MRSGQNLPLHVTLCDSEGIRMKKQGAEGLTAGDKADKYSIL